MDISDLTLRELAMNTIDSIDLENISLHNLLVERGLSREAAKDLICYLIDQYKIISTKPKLIKPDTYESDQERVRTELVDVYGFTYSMADKLLERYDITDVQQISLITDEELLGIRGFGTGSLNSIRAAFPYIIKAEEGQVSISVLKLPSHVERTLADEGMLYIEQLNDGLINKSLPISVSTIVEEAYRGYVEDGKRDFKLVVSYLDIMLTQISRNLGNITRHVNDKLNLYWIDDSVCSLVTYLCEIAAKTDEGTILYDIYPDLKFERSKLKESIKAPLKQNDETVKFYTNLYNKLESVVSKFKLMVWRKD